MKVKIGLHGCDDSTEFTMDVMQQELDFLDRLSKLSEEVSTYGCMPILSYEAEEESP